MCRGIGFLPLMLWRYRYSGKGTESETERGGVIRAHETTGRR
jgi:hypothetical protein